MAARNPAGRRPVPAVRDPDPSASRNSANDASARVLRRFRVVFNAVRTHFRAVEKKAGLAGAQVWALSVVAARPGIGVSDLARAMDIHQSTASNLLRPMLEMGLVATVRSGADRRAVHLNVTPEGARILRKAPGPFTGVLPQALASLDTATLARLDHDLALVIQALGADTQDGQVPLGRLD